MNKFIIINVIKNMNINHPYIKNINLIKIKKENELISNMISHRENIRPSKSLLKDTILNKSSIKEKSTLIKFTTKTCFENNCNIKSEKLYTNKEMKKNLTHRTFDLNNTNKETHNIRNLKYLDVLNSNKIGESSKGNKEFKIKVKKVFDLNELTFPNITNDNTTSSNRHKENTAFEKLNPEKNQNSYKNELKSFDEITVKKSDCEIEGRMIEKQTEIIRSLILQEFPLFRNSLIINDKINNENPPRNFNNVLDIETLPNMKYSEVNSLNESHNDNTSNSSFTNKNSYKLRNKIDSNLNCNNINNESQNNNDNYNNQSLDEDMNNYITKRKKSGATQIKETFTLFLQNNSKKEFLNENSTDKMENENEIIRNNFRKNNNNNNKSINCIKSLNQIPVPTKEGKIKLDSSRKFSETEKQKNNKIENKLSNYFHSPQKNLLKFSKTKNILSSLSNKVFDNNKSSIIELSQKVANCDNILSCFEQNKKLKSEVEILSEKIKTFKKIQQNKSYELEILKTKYSEAIESYKGEIEKNKNLKEKIASQISFAKNIKKNFQIFANNLIEITELLLLSKSSAERRASLLAPENASLSIDIYDSYNNEEEKKSLLQEQIQALLLAKFLYLKNHLNLDLDAEIEKIKNWNNNPNFINGRNNSSNNISNNSNNIEMSISNIKITALNKHNENDSFESSKKNISQDYFDLSISNQFLNLNQIPSGNFGNLGSNINININQNPQFIFTKNNYNSKQNPHNNSFGAIDCENDNIFGTNSNKNYNSNTNNTNNNNNNLNQNGNVINSNNNNSNNFYSNKEKGSNSNINNLNGSNIKKNKWKIIFNKEEQMDMNNCNWNKLNYNSNNREDRFRIDSINNLIGANSFNKNLALSSNYNSNSNNIFDSFLQSAKGPNDSFSNSANDSILQIVNFNNPNPDKENKRANKSKSNKQLNEVEILSDLANNTLGKITNLVDLKKQINRIQNDSSNFIFEESKAKSENYNSDNEYKHKFVYDELVNKHINNNNCEIENFKDNFSEKNNGNQLKRMFSFEL